MWNFLVLMSKMFKFNRKIVDGVGIDIDEFELVIFNVLRLDIDNLFNLFGRIDEFRVILVEFL